MMRIAIVGADYEENLGIGAIAAACELAGYKVDVLAFNEVSELTEVTAKIVSKNPDVVGLSIQFQHRAFDFLCLAKKLRAAGFNGHITCGGQFPTMAYRNVLDSPNAVDSIVLHEGEHTIVELLDALIEGKPLSQIAGLAIKDENGIAVRTAGRPLTENLDELPIPQRYRQHSKHLGIPFIPIMGGRGCWGSCAFCSISTFYRDARKYAGARLLRYRSPKHIAAEMALLWHTANGQAVFCFHDDNILLPRPEESLERLRAIRSELDRFDVGKVSIIGKCRPETLTPELAAELRDLGVIRLYVGVENVSPGGSEHLNRRVQTKNVRRALAACRSAGIFACYNLLIFEPEATLDDVEQNIAFIRWHALHPVNFCRAEAYHGTPLHQRLKAEGNLGGSYLGYDYRIKDDRTELLFRICAAAFRQRNFDSQGVHNRYMSIGYQVKILQTYYPDSKGRLSELVWRAEELTRSIALETASFLEEALGLARRVDLADREIIERETALLGLRIADADAVRHVELDDLCQAMEAYAKESKLPRLVQAGRETWARVSQQLVQGVAVGSWLIATSGLQACANHSGTYRDALPQDSAITEGGKDSGTAGASDAGGAGGAGGMRPTVVDMVPYDSMTGDPVVSDPVPPDVLDSGRIDGGPIYPYDSMVSDPIPYDSTFVDAVPRDTGVDSRIVPDANRDVSPPPVDPLPADSSSDNSQYKTSFSDDDAVLAQNDSSSRSPIIDKWRDTAPKRARRSDDLPLNNPLNVSLKSTRQKDGIYVFIVGAPRAVSARWQSDGDVIGYGRSVVWHPKSDKDQISVAVWSLGGVAIISLRANAVG
jgi:anaerobic magnesium-protoporphyrin IX monomethyl ester cyclase